MCGVLRFLFARLRRTLARLEVDVEIGKLRVQALHFVIHEGESVLREMPVGRRIVEANLEANTAARVGIWFHQIASAHPVFGVESAGGAGPQREAVMMARGQ